MVVVVSGGDGGGGGVDGGGGGDVCVCLVVGLFVCLCLCVLASCSFRLLLFQKLAPTIFHVLVCLFVCFRRKKSLKNHAPSDRADSHRRTLYSTEDKAIE